MKKKIKKNQIMITALALMIAVAGYMQFSGNYLNNDELADGGQDVEEMQEYTADLDIVTDEEDVVTMLDMDLSDVNMETVTDDVVAQMENGTSSDAEGQTVADLGGTELDTQAGAEMADLDTTEQENGTPGEAVFTSTTAQMSLSDAKLLKEQSRAQNKAGLLEIINNEQLAESAKQSAVQSLVNLTDVAERELAAEILLEAKGFDSAIVSISGTTVDVVLSSVDLTDAQRAQIEDIVTRKTGISAENIIISPVVEN